MKTFKDLELEGSYSTKEATLSFKNGYGVYVLSKVVGLTNANNPYVALTTKGGFTCFDTHIKNSVISLRVI